MASRFIDILRRDGPHLHARKANIFEVPNLKEKWNLLRSAVPIVIDDVFNLIFPMAESAEKFKSLEGILGPEASNVAPPFENFFMEWETKAYAELHAKHRWFGVHFYTMPSWWPKSTQLKEMERALSGPDRGQVPRQTTFKWKYVVEMYQYWNDKNEAMGPFYFQQWFIHESGWPHSWLSGWTSDFTNSREQINGYKANLMFAEIALCFMNSHAVLKETESVRHPFLVTTDDGPAEPKPTEPPDVTYKTLDISPIVEILNSEGRMGEVGVERAFHLCRAHWRHYKKSGKDVHVREHHRGNPDKGVVVKTYNVGGKQLCPCGSGKKYKTCCRKIGK